MMCAPGTHQELQLRLRGTQARVSQKSRELSLKVSCAADRRCSCKTNRCCSCWTPGFANSVKRTSLILFRSCAEAYRASIELRVVECSKRFSAVANKALPRRPKIGRASCRERV